MFTQCGLSSRTNQRSTPEGAKVNVRDLKIAFKIDTSLCSDVSLRACRKNDKQCLGEHRYYCQRFSSSKPLLVKKPTFCFSVFSCRNAGYPLEIFSKDRLGWKIQIITDLLN